MNIQLNIKMYIKNLYKIIMNYLDGLCAAQPKSPGSGMKPEFPSRTQAWYELGDLGKSSGAWIYTVLLNLVPAGIGQSPPSQIVDGYE